MRLRFRIESIEPGGGGTSIGTRAWTAYSPAVSRSNGASFPVHATDDVVEVVVDLRNFDSGDEDRLERLLFAPIDRPGTFTSDSIAIERC